MKIHPHALYRWHFKQIQCHATIPQNIYQSMVSMGKKALPNETGGTLVGRYEAGGREAIVDHVLQAGVGARSGPAFFYRPPDKTDSQLQEFTKSQTECHYIGEWHTHPNGGAYPSTRDLATLAELAKSGAAGTRHPLLFILGGDFIEVCDFACILADPSGRCYPGTFCPTVPMEI